MASVSSFFAALASKKDEHKRDSEQENRATNEHKGQVHIHRRDDLGEDEKEDRVVSLESNRIRKMKKDANKALSPQCRVLKSQQQLSQRNDAMKTWHVGTSIRRNTQPGWPQDAGQDPALLSFQSKLSSAPERSLLLGFSIGDKVTTPWGRQAMVLGTNKDPKDDTDRICHDNYLGHRRTHLWAEYMKSSEPETSTGSERLCPEETIPDGGSNHNSTSSKLETTIVAPSKWYAEENYVQGDITPNESKQHHSRIKQASSSNYAISPSKSALSTLSSSSLSSLLTSSSYPLKDHRSLRPMVRVGLPSRAGFFLPGRETLGAARGSQLTSLPYLKLLFTRSEFEDMTHHDNFRTAEWLRSLSPGDIVWSPTGVQMKIHELKTVGRKSHLDQMRVWASPMFGKQSSTLTPLEEPVIGSTGHSNGSALNSNSKVSNDIISNAGFTSRLSKACQFTVVKEERLLKDRVTPMAMKPNLVDRFRDDRDTPAAIAKRCGFAFDVQRTHSRPRRDDVDINYSATKFSTAAVDRPVFCPQGTTNNELTRAVHPRLGLVYDRIEARRKLART